MLVRPIGHTSPAMMCNDVIKSFRWTTGMKSGEDSPCDRPVPATRSPGSSVDSRRLEAFSDGVFAVAITILALNLSVAGPGQHRPGLAAQLGDHWPAFAAYAVSFAAIGIVWVNHHTLFKNFSEIDRAAAGH